MRKNKSKDLILVFCPPVLTMYRNYDFSTWVNLFKKCSWFSYLETDNMLKQRNEKSSGLNYIQGYVL